MISDLRELRAFRFAKKKHYGQKDDNGLCYFTVHILNVVNIVKCLPYDSDLICAAYLHDTIEDTETTYGELINNFGIDVADLVMEVTHEGTKDNKGYYFPRLKSKKGILLKFADRLSNLSRMESWDEKRQAQYLAKSKFWKSE